MQASSIRPMHWSGQKSEDCGGSSEQSHARALSIAVVKGSKKEALAKEFISVYITRREKGFRKIWL